MYNPSLHTATNKPVGITNKPVDARTYYYDTASFSYRPYASESEVIRYLVGNNRVGQFSIIVGNDEYWFKNGIADSDLVKKATANPAPYVDFVTAGDNMPKLVGIPGRFANREINVKFERILPDSGGFYPTTTDGATMVYVSQYDIADRTNVSRIDISGAPDGDGKFADSFKFTIYAL